MTIFDELKRGLVTDSPGATEAAAARLAATLPENVAIGLSGDLGTGKTTFVRGLARGLGISSDVTSPTYTIYTIYPGDRQLVHMDAYRLQDAHQLDSLAVEDLLRPPFLIAVEWPEHIPGFLDAFPAYRISMEIRPDRRHRISLQPGV